MLVLERAYKQLNPDRCCRWELPGCAGHGFFWPATSSLAHKAVIRSNFSFAVASNDGLFHLSLNGKGVFCIEADAPRKNWLKFPHNEVVKMTETMPSLGAQLDFYARTLQHPRLAPWSLERGLVNVYRRTGSILMMPTAKMPNV